jgi:hypothetical protein
LAPAGSGAAVEAWLRAQQPGALATARRCAPHALSSVLVACDKRGMPDASRACALVADGLLVHCSDRPNPLVVAAMFSLPSADCTGMWSHEPDGAALAAADAYVNGGCGGSFRRWRTLGARLAGRGAAARRQQPRRTIHAPEWVSLQHRLGCGDNS